MKKYLRISKFKPSAFQGKFDFEAVAKRQTQVLAMEHPAERYALSMLLLVLATLFCAYLYFVVGSVFNVIAEKEADARSNQIQTSINTLEEQYFSLTQSLTPQAASDMGLAPIRETQYVYRPGDAAAVESPVRAI